MIHFGTRRSGLSAGEMTTPTNRLCWSLSTRPREPLAVLPDVPLGQMRAGVQLARLPG
jgi:hypothetical protein